jgi:rhodanese-related sulfurtransferase
MMKRLLCVSIALSLGLAAQQKKAEPKPSEQKGTEQTMAHNPGFLKLVDDAKSRIQQIDIEQYKKMVSAGDKHVLVDTREDSEWTAGHVAGAVHMSRGIIERDVETKYPDKATKLVLYCGGGFRSALSADSLQKMGYTHVISLDGGWRALKDSGLPVEK